MPLWSVLVAVCCCFAAALKYIRLLFFICCGEAVLSLPTGRCTGGTEASLHPRGDGTGAHGTQPIQGEADGAAGGCQVDWNDQVGKHISIQYCLEKHILPSLSGGLHDMCPGILYDLFIMTIEDKMEQCMPEPSWYMTNLIHNMPTKLLIFLSRHVFNHTIFFLALIFAIDVLLMGCGCCSHNQDLLA